VNGWEEAAIADVIYAYGEERFARRIAKAIVEKREVKEIKTTFELVDIIRASVPVFYTKGRLHFATRTFQALRIAVNDELGALKDLVKKAIIALAPGGRLAIISFHSLEDRIVKQMGNKAAEDELINKITKKPLIPTEDEQMANPRSRSAKLRIIEKIS
jgi:16S rRNA (cytosine1402-N4)-methyltransferase